MLDLSVIVLTHNEERHIGRCLAAVRRIARTTIVVDSFSTDRTVNIAQSEGAVVLRNEFVNYAKQFEWALANAPISTSWIMRLDADEVIESELIEEIVTKLPILGPEVVGINLKRKLIFMDRWIRYGGRYPLILLRIWRHGFGRIENRWMDEHMIVWGGRTLTLDGGFSDHNLNDLTFFTDKHNKYATREAIDVINQKYALFFCDQTLSSRSTSLQASFKRVIKKNVYNRVPFWISAPGYFVFRYILQLGFLDGYPGLIYHFLQGFWYRFLVGAKVLEFEKELRHCGTNADRVATLEKLTGYTFV
jgi:glycosyltransferase involved in cell wall biosynthesis